VVPLTAKALATSRSVWSALIKVLGGRASSPTVSWPAASSWSMTS
jgi:hypothetical protein